MMKTPPTASPVTMPHPSCARSSPRSTQRYVPTRRRSPRRRAPSRSFWDPNPPTIPQHPQAMPQEPTDTKGIARLLLATLSPSYFAESYLGFTPEPAQRKILDAAVHNQRLALNCNRQWGKSTVAAILIAHRLFT